MAVVELNDQNFPREVLDNQKPVLVDFWAPWCFPCQTMNPIIKQLAQLLEGKVKVGKLNVDENPQTARQFEITSIPTLIIFKKGQVVERMTGVQSQEAIKTRIEKILESSYRE